MSFEVGFALTWLLPAFFPRTIRGNYCENNSKKEQQAAAREGFN
jgi:hypothetical protein